MHDHENIVDLIGKHWGWLGVRPKGIVDINQFGNVIFLDLVGQYWRICPEALSCEIIADSKITFSDLLKTEEFQIDWGMEPLVEQANGKLGSLKPGYVYYLVIPAIFGGEYSASNMQTVPLGELIHLSGNFAHEIQDLPDGAQIELKIVD